MVLICLTFVEDRIFGGVDFRWVLEIWVIGARFVFFVMVLFLGFICCGSIGKVISFWGLSRLDFEEFCV